MKRGLLLLGGFIACLALVACNSITTQLDLLISTTSAIVDIVTPQNAQQLAPYFTSLTNFVDQVTTELATTDTVAQKTAVIVDDAAAIVKPDLSGVPQTVVTRIGAIAPLVAEIVAEVSQLTAAIDQTPDGANAFFAAHKQFKAPSAGDLEKIRKKNADLKSKIRAKKSVK
jgi:hypothetical protein